MIGRNIERYICGLREEEITVQRNKERQGGTGCESSKRL